MTRIDYSKLAKHVVKMTNRLQEGRMTRTDALREIMKEAIGPHSLKDLQERVQRSTGRWLTDGTISRRLRQWGAHCERGKDGIFRYSLRKPQQPNLF